MRKNIDKKFWNIEVWAVQKHVNLVDLVKSFPTNISLQNLASIQKRTSLVKFAHLAEKSENGSISNLSTKVPAKPGDDGDGTSILSIHHVWTCFKNNMLWCSYTNVYIDISERGKVSYALFWSLQQGDSYHFNTHHDNWRQPSQTNNPQKKTGFVRWTARDCSPSSGS